VFSDGLASRAIDHSGGLVCIWVDEFTFEALSDLVIGIGIPASGTTSMTPGTGFTSWSGSGGYNAVYQFASSAGTYTPTINENDQQFCFWTLLVHQTLDRSNLRGVQSQLGTASRENAAAGVRTVRNRKTGRSAAKGNRRRSTSSASPYTASNNDDWRFANGLNVTQICL
jgi:hypothetical protein